MSLEGRKGEEMASYWRIADGIAWVGDEGRVALIDTRSTSAPPMLVPPLFADLWRLLSDGPQSESDLTSHANELVDEDGPELMKAFVETLSGADLIEPVGGDA